MIPIFEALALPASVFFALAVFDVFIGGRITAMLQQKNPGMFYAEDWSDLDQRTNDAYQHGYGIIIAAATLLMAIGFGIVQEAIIVFLNLLLYGEDFWFYVLIPVFKPLIKFFNRGIGFQSPAGGLFPEKGISGWLGAAGRMFLGRNVRVPIPIVIIATLISHGFSFLIVWQGWFKF